MVVGSSHLMNSDATQVLVIDDDAETCANVRDILQLDGYDVATAGTVAEVLRRDDLRTFQVVLLDFRLPDGTAETLLPKLRALAPDAAVIVATGTVGLEGALLAIRCGAVDFVLK